VNGLRPFGDMASLITIAERLRALQTESVAFSETNIEWHKYELRENMHKLFTKAFGAAHMESVRRQTNSKQRITREAALPVGI
jgi:hypothetical protein